MPKSRSRRSQHPRVAAASKVSPPVSAAPATVPPLTTLDALSACAVDLAVLEARRADLLAHRLALVLAARAEGVPWARIESVCGVTRQAVQSPQRRHASPVLGRAGAPSRPVDAGPAAGADPVLAAAGVVVPPGHELAPLWPVSGD